MLAVRVNRVYLELVFFTFTEDTIQLISYVGYPEVFMFCLIFFLIKEVCMKHDKKSQCFSDGGKHAICVIPHTCG